MGCGEAFQRLAIQSVAQPVANEWSRDSKGRVPALTDSTQRGAGWPFAGASNGGPTRR